MHDNYEGLRLEVPNRGLTDSLKHKTNPKFEARNPKRFDRPFENLGVLSSVEGLTTLSHVEGQCSNDQDFKMINRATPFCAFVLNIRTLNLFSASDFDIRIYSAWDL
jgi:hypothetical protein